MGRGTLKWGQVQAALARRGFRFASDGGDTLVIAPESHRPRSRAVVRIGHKCSNSRNDDVWPCYVRALTRAFGLTRRQLGGDA